MVHDLLDDGEIRRRLTRDIFVPDASEDGLGRLEAALGLVVIARKAQRKIRDAVYRGALDAEPAATLTERALAGGVISADERERVDQAARARDAVIQVDSFAPETYAGLKG